jgi:segregation and condensation protein B
MEQEQLKAIIEGALLASSEALTVNKLAGLFEGEDERPEKEEIRAVLKELEEDAKDHAYELVKVASGWRYQVRQGLAHWVGRLWEEKPPRYTRATLETLALIAYRQPITRGDIEDVRGVSVSSNTIKSLMERDWIRVVGHRDVPGRPALYATTKEFLDYFNLKSLDQLPSLSEIKDLESINQELQFDSDASGAGEAAGAENPETGQAGSDSDYEFEADPDNDEADASMVTLFLPGGDPIC